MRNVFDDFKNEKFQALPYKKKKEADKYLVVDDRYKNADEKLRNKIKDAIASDVIDFKVGDTIDRTKEFINENKDKNAAEILGFEKQTPAKEQPQQEQVLQEQTPQPKKEDDNFGLHTPDANYVNLTPDKFKNDFNTLPQNVDEATKAQKRAEKSFQYRKNTEALQAQDQPLEDESLYFVGGLAGGTRAFQGAVAKTVAKSEAERVAAEKMVSSGNAFAKSDIVGNTVGAVAMHTADYLMSDDFKKSHPNIAALIEISAGLAGGGYAGYKAQKGVLQADEAVIKKHEALLDDVKSGKVQPDDAEEILKKDDDVKQTVDDFLKQSAPTKVK